MTPQKYGRGKQDEEPLWFIKLIQDRERYLKWAGVASGSQPERKQPKVAPDVFDNLAEHVRDKAGDWLAHGLTDFNRYGPVGVKINRIPTVVSRAALQAQQGVAHYKIVQDVANILGFNDPKNGQDLLRQFLEATGTGTTEPLHPWSWNQVRSRYGQHAEKWAELLAGGHGHPGGLYRKTPRIRPTTRNLRAGHLCTKKLRPARIFRIH